MQYNRRIGVHALENAVAMLCRNQAFATIAIPRQNLPEQIRPVSPCRHVGQF